MNLGAPSAAGLADRNSKAFLAALLLAFFSGAAGLIHQLLWTRRMVDLLGASNESAVRVFASFFLGLALGAAAAGWIVPRTKRLWRFVGVAEFLVALTAAGICSLPFWSDAIWRRLGPEVSVEFTGQVLKYGVSILIVGVPAFFMGLVLPALTAAVVCGKASMRQEGVWLYATNTAGGAFGLLLAAGVLISRVGATNSMLVAMAINVCLAAGCLWADRTFDFGKSPAPHPATCEDSQEEKSPGVAPWLISVLAFFSGAGILAAEATTHQMIMLVATLSYHAPATILFCVILMLALGAFATSPLLRAMRSWSDCATLSAVLAVSGLAFALTPLGFMAMAHHARFLTENDSVPEFVFKLGGLVLITTGPAFFFAGLLFPFLMSRIAKQENAAGRRLAWLLALNGMGGFAGAEIAYRILLPLAGPHGGTALLGGGYAAAALLVAIVSGSHLVVWGGVTACFLTFGLFKPVFRLPLINSGLGFRILDQWAGREGTVAVVEDKRKNRSILISNQYFLGGTGAKTSQQWQAWLPLLLHDNPKDVAFIGLATGTTPGAALADSRVGKITAIEISPLVKNAAAEYFTDVNGDIAQNSRARIIVDDGRTYLAACESRFDVIAGDLFLPWGPGEARLFSLEHFQGVRRALQEGGVFCQWLPLYQLTPSQVETIAATFQKVFPATFVFASPTDEKLPILALVGFRGDQTPDLSRIGSRSSAISSYTGSQTIQALYLGAWTSINPVTLNTLGNLAIELDAGRERLTGHSGLKYLHGRRWAEYREELLRRISKK